MYIDIIPVMMLSDVRTRANSVALKLTVPSLLSRMFIDTSRCNNNINFYLMLQKLIGYNPFLLFFVTILNEYFLLRVKSNYFL